MKLTVEIPEQEIKQGDHFKNEFYLWVVIKWHKEDGVAQWALANVTRGNFWTNPAVNREDIFGVSRNDFTKVNITLQKG